MEKEVVKNQHPHTSNTNSISTSTSLRERQIIGDGLIKPPQSADFVLQWGNRKRLRCMKIQAKNETAPMTRTTVRRVITSDGNDNKNIPSGSNGNHSINGHFNLRQRSASPARLPARALRNTDSPGMKGVHHNNNSNSNNNNGGVRGLASPDRGEKKSGAHHNHDNMMINGGGKTTSSETKNGTSSGGGSDVVWPPKFMIALTNKEKEEDFMAIKGSKLPQRPKKRAKFIQRTLNLVSPGGWLCDLTLERYEVREKKISKKRPRGLKAMGNYMDSDSE
ncbi:uncharacterized protein LOC141612129 [Silene latifolia]|uniref:uncharacterized protein LOC141612129 n=1 Tax=Silene latifolia TaxID=37657 RepID=UPI003D773532